MSLDPKERNSTFPLSVSLLNLSGLGLGYLVMKKWLLWGLHFLGSLLIIVLGSILDASENPFLWIGIAVIWLLYMALDGLRRARKTSILSSLLPASTPSWTMLVIPGLVLIFTGALFQGYHLAGVNTYRLGLDAYQALDLDRAIDNFQKFSNLYQLTLNQDIQKAEKYIPEGEILRSAEEARADQQYEEAVGLYKRYQLMTSREGLRSYANESIADAYAQWGEDLLRDDEFESALEKYEIVKNDYASTLTGGEIDEHLADLYLSWAGSLREEGRHEVALQKAETALDEYPDTTSGSQAREEIGEIYEQWCAALITTQKFDEAVQKSKTLLEEYSGTSAASRNTNLTAEIYRVWADYLQSEGEYADYLEKLNVLETSYKNAPQSQNLEDEKIQLYWDWARQLRDRDQYAAANEKYQHLMNNYPDSDIYTRAEESHYQTLVEWGHYAHDQNDFEEAMQVFQQVQDTCPIEDLTAQAETGYQDALIGLSRDEGSAGKRIISETFDLVCDGGTAASPAIGISDDEPARALSCSSKYTMPDHLKATHPGHFKFVIEIVENESLLQNCPYTGGHNILRYRYSWQVTVRRTTNGSVYSYKTIYGSNPGKCELFESFSLKTKTRYGGKPSPSDLTAWLEVLFK